jgi:ABC-type Fe3+-hydroxamate transport system substrate-binding protein
MNLALRNAPCFRSFSDDSADARRSTGPCYHPSGNMRPRLVLAVVLLGGCASLALLWWYVRVDRTPAPLARGPRIVSLSPAITETLFALGVGDLVVGVTLHCNYPPEAAKIARIGGGTNPDLEAIARLGPTVILGERTLRVTEQMLGPLAPTHLFPWLTPFEVTRGIREIGALVDRRSEAEAVASAMERRWRQTPLASAPRVVMVFADKPGRLGPMYFAKPGSLHDVMLGAAGARNAIEGPVRGAPILSVEELLRVNPDAIILLVATDDLSPEARDQYLADFEALPSLRAVREHRVRVLNGSILFATGPRSVAAIDRIAAALRDINAGASERSPVGSQGSP